MFEAKRGSTCREVSAAQEVPHPPQPHRLRNPSKAPSCSLCLELYASCGVSGQYCIYKKNSCPIGFKEGWLYWDDAAPWFGETIQNLSGQSPVGPSNMSTHTANTYTAHTLTSPHPDHTHTATHTHTLSLSLSHTHTHTHTDTHTNKHTDVQFNQVCGSRNSPDFSRC